VTAETILTRICAHKRGEIAQLKRDGLGAERDGALRGFHAALRGKEPVGLIAEIKKASPSKGLIRSDFDPAALGQAYEKGGAHCLSVLTDREFFQGAPEYLHAVRAACRLPVLRKDFILDPVQVEETHRLGADALLLIVAALAPAQLEELFLQAQALGLEVLVEVHDEHELETALRVDPPLIGVNNRNLKDFSVDLATTGRIAAEVPAGVTLVSESGISTRADIDVVRAAGATAVLVGESLMRQEDVAQAVRELLGKGQE
jgi:indole-3-glycerol phosphate synthase